MDNLNVPNYVQFEKNSYMNDIKAFLQGCFKSDDHPGTCFYISRPSRIALIKCFLDFLEEFLNCMVAMDFVIKPDYSQTNEQHLPIKWLTANYVLSTRRTTNPASKKNECPNKSQCTWHAGQCIHKT